MMSNQFVYDLTVMVINDEIIMISELVQRLGEASTHNKRIWH